MKTLLAPFLALLAASSVFAAPANDDLLNAQVIAGSLIQVDGTLIASTIEIAESTSLNGTVWYSWTAPANGLVAVGASFLNSVRDRSVTIFQLNGPRSTLNLVGIAQSRSFYQFPVMAGVPVALGAEYLIRVSSRPYFSSEPRGPFGLSLSFTPQAFDTVGGGGGSGGTAPALGTFTKVKNRIGSRAIIRGRFFKSAKIKQVVVKVQGKARVAKVKFKRKTGEFSFVSIKKGNAKEKTSVRFRVIGKSGGNTVATLRKRVTIR